jgi:hypothetical protein
MLVEDTCIYLLQVESLESDACSFLTLDSHAEPWNVTWVMDADHTNRF